MSSAQENLDHAAIGREYADNLIGEPAVSKCLHAMADEIERLRGYRDEAEAHAALADMVVSKFRLTFNECETIRRAAVWNEGVAEDVQAAGLEPEGRWHREDAETLRNLLKRHGDA